MWTGHYRLYQCHYHQCTLRSQGFLTKGACFPGYAGRDQIQRGCKNNLITRRCIKTFKVLMEAFSTLHGMPARTSDEKGVCLSVCLSVRPSVKRVDCDKTEERSVQIFIPYEISFSLVF